MSIRQLYKRKAGRPEGQPAPQTKSQDLRF